MACHIGPPLKPGDRCAGPARSPARQGHAWSQPPAPTFLAARKAPELLSTGPAALALLGGVFLCATGGEALYADMGHFGRLPIRLAWYGVVLPCLLLSYTGQVGLVLGGIPKGANPFFLQAPGWAVIPLVPSPAPSQKAPPV